MAYKMPTREYVWQKGSRISISNLYLIRDALNLEETHCKNIKKKIVKHKHQNAPNMPTGENLVLQ